MISCKEAATHRASRFGVMTARASTIAFRSIASTTSLARERVSTTTRGASRRRPSRVSCGPFDWLQNNKDIGGRDTTFEAQQEILRKRRSGANLGKEVAARRAKVSRFVNKKLPSAEQKAIEERNRKRRTRCPRRRSRVGYRFRWRVLACPNSMAAKDSIFAASTWTRGGSIPRTPSAARAVSAVYSGRRKHRRRRVRNRKRRVGFDLSCERTACNGFVIVRTVVFRLKMCRLKFSYLVAVLLGAPQRGAALRAPAGDEHHIRRPFHARR